MPLELLATIMDLNQLFHAHQLAVMKLDSSKEGDADHSQSEGVSRFAERIQRLRDHYAGDGLGQIESWESEGGFIQTAGGALPGGIIRVMRYEYHVGAFVYDDLSLAIAEQQRQTLGAKR